LNDHSFLISSNEMTFLIYWKKNKTETYNYTTNKNMSKIKMTEKKKN
jgi:hypothetical protein